MLTNRSLFWILKNLHWNGLFVLYIYIFVHFFRTYILIQFWYICSYVQINNLFFKLLGIILRIRSFLKKMKLFQLFRCYNELFLDQLKNDSIIIQFETCSHGNFGPLFDKGSDWQSSRKVWSHSWNINSPG